MNALHAMVRRLVAIDAEIRTNTFPNCTQLAEKLGTSAKTIQRDLDSLREDHGAPLAYDATRHGYVYTDPSWFLPPLRFTEGDVLALLLGQQALKLYEGTPLAAQLQRVYTRMSAFLPEELSIQPELLSERFSFTNAPSRPVDTTTWQGILRGLLHQRVLDTQYQSPRRETPRAHVLRPYHIVNIEGDWYLLAHDEREGEVRQFALSRFRKVDVLERRFDVPDDFSASTLLAQRQGRFVRRSTEGAETIVRLRFARESSVYIKERSWHPREEAHQRMDGSLDLSIPAQNPADLLPWILGFGAQVEVLSPKSLREQVKAQLRTALGRYSG